MTQTLLTMAKRGTEQATLKPVSATHRIEWSSAPTDPAWDAFLATHPDGHHAQSTAWSRLKAQLGWQVLRLLLTKDGVICGGAQLLRRNVAIGGAIAHLPKGPLIAASALHDEPRLTRYLLDEVQRMVQQQRIHYLLLQPPDHGWTLLSQLEERGLQPSLTTAMPTATVLIDLQQSREEILAGMKKKRRYGVRRSAKDGITVRAGTAADLPLLQQLLSATSERQGFTPFQLDYLQTMWQLFAPRGQIQLLIADYAGQPVSAQLLLAFGDTVAAKLFGWSGEHGERRPNEALDWASICWAKEAGYRYYDLEGIAPEAADALRHGKPLPTHLAQTPTSYKVDFGGKIVRYPPPLEYIANPLLRAGYRHIYPRLREWALVKHLISRFRSR